MSRSARLRTASLTLSLLLLAAAGRTQFVVLGTVLDDGAEPVAFANVVLVAAADTGFVAGAVTDADGAYVIEVDTAAGEFRLRASSIGYADAYTAGFSGSQTETYAPGPIMLSQAGVELAVATVTAEQPLVVRQIDRTIVNVAGQPTALGQTALEVLERAPGVFVDRQSGAVAMLGKDGVRVMVNGRLNYMPASALLAYLAGVPASDIVRLELITTPPADLDAEGNAGYVDIVLRRLPDEGLQGTYALTGGLGSNRSVTGDWGAGEELAANAGLTYRRGRVAAFGNLSYVRSARPTSSYLRRSGPSDAGEQTVDLGFDRDNVRDVVNARAGADFQVGERTTLGVLASGYVNRYRMDGAQANRFSVRRNGVQGPHSGVVPDSLLLTDLRETNDWDHLQAAVSLSQKLAAGATLSAGVDYLWYDNRNPVDYALDYRAGAGGETVRRQRLASDKQSPFGIAVARVNDFFGWDLLARVREVEGLGW